MHKYLIGLLFAFATQAHAASNWVEGKDYFPIKPAQPTNVAPGKIEVIEVFSYGCIACYNFYAAADKLKAGLPKNAEMSFVHASFNPAEAWPMFQRAYITAQALGIADKTHTAMFKAIWESDELAVVDQRTNRIKTTLPTIEKAAAFYERVAGVKKEDFLKTAKSFSVEIKIKSSEAAIKAYHVDGTPTIIVNGKYRFTPPRDPNETIELVKFLIAKESQPQGK